MRIVPISDELSAEFWAGCAEHVLRLARCTACQQVVLPPEIVCPDCGSDEPNYTYVETSGNGVIRAWTKVHHSFLQGFDLPFTLVDVQLDAHPGIRLVARLLDGNCQPPRLYDPVRMAFEDIVPGVSLPIFVREAAR